MRELPRELYAQHGGKSLHLVHGSPRRINEYLLPDRDTRTFERLAADEPGDVLVFGHTHQFWQKRIGEVEFVNVPSVGRPKDGDPRAGYAVLEVGESRVQTTPVRVEYDVEAAARAVLDVGLPESLADSMRRGR